MRGRVLTEETSVVAQCTPRFCDGGSWVSTLLGAPRETSPAQDAAVPPGDTLLGAFTEEDELVDIGDAAEEWGGLGVLDLHRLVVLATTLRFLCGELTVDDHCSHGSKGRLSSSKPFRYDTALSR